MTQYETVAEAPKNDLCSYAECLEDPDYWRFLNKCCFTREETDKYKRAVGNAMSFIRTDAGRTSGSFLIWDDGLYVFLVRVILGLFWMRSGQAV